MTTPARQITAAVAKLRALTEPLPTEWGDRPWHAEECGNAEMQHCPCIVAQGEYREFDQPQEPLIQYVADAETPEFAAYIAAMHPGVGELLAKWLASWQGIDFSEAAALPEDAQHAIAVAHAINGTAS